MKEKIEKKKNSKEKKRNNNKRIRIPNETKPEGNKE